jgi:simple sugar transport system permease protein
MRHRLQRGPAPRVAIALAARAVAVLLALMTAALALALSGSSPLTLTRQVFTDTFGSAFALEDLGLLVTPLILTGLAVAVALRIGAWNIGAEGQFNAGALAAAGVGLFVPGPTVIVLPLMLAAGVGGGAVWILGPALARTYAGVSELITTLLLNFVAALLVYWVSTGPWLDPGGRAIGTTARIVHEIPEVWGAVHWGLPAAIVLTLGIGGLLTYSRWGYEIRICGSNPQAARYAGMPVRGHLLAVMLLSGAIAGAAGMLELAGTVHRLQGGIANNFGYLGITVAVLARRSTLGVLGGALFMAMLLNSGSILSTRGVDVAIVLALMGLVLLYVAIGDEVAHYRLVRRDATAPEDPPQSSNAMKSHS